MNDRVLICSRSQNIHNKIGINCFSLSIFFSSSSLFCSLLLRLMINLIDLLKSKWTTLIADVWYDEEAAQTSHCSLFVNLIFKIVYHLFELLLIIVLLCKGFVRLMNGKTTMMLYCCSPHLYNDFHFQHIFF